jgi:uncharacterized protein
MSTDVTPPLAAPESGIGSDEKTWMMLTHLSALSGHIIPFGNIVGPLIIWNIFKDKYVHVNAHGKRAVNFQISILIWFVCAIPLCFVCIGIPMVVALAITNIVCIIVAAVRASDGRDFHYPLSIQFIK